MKKQSQTKGVIIYQAKNGAIELRGDFKRDTIWATQAQIADIFDTTTQNITIHFKSIFAEQELEEKATCKEFLQVQKEGKRNVTRTLKFYSLDAIIAVGYRINSKRATQFRIWATKTLRRYITEGYVINRNRIAKNYGAFMRAVEDVRALLPSGMQADTGSILELIKIFADTWVSLEAYDKSAFPAHGTTKKHVAITAKELIAGLSSLKQELAAQGETGDLFGFERQSGSIAGIVGNVLQSFGGKPLYPTAEEKAAHLLYFMVKNHPFADGNKRSGAFALVWFLRRAQILNTARMSPATLTALTLLVAESNPADKKKMIGLVLMILKK